MSYAKRNCGCGVTWIPSSRTAADRGTCGRCADTQKHAGVGGVGQYTYSLEDGLKFFEPAASPGEVKWVPGARMVCPICGGVFTQKEPHQESHKACVGRVKKGFATNPMTMPTPYKDADYSPGKPVPKWTAAPAGIRSPFRVAVLDLETFSLDRGWGIVLIGVIVMFGDGEPREYRFRLDQFETFKRDRSDDSEIVAAIFSVLEEAHIIVAHNGAFFDIPYLNSVALKYGMPPIQRKLRDPVQVLRAKFRIGSNSLQAAADFLGLEQSKIHVPSEVWRQAAFNGSKENFDILEERCASDVYLLAEVAERVEAFAGQVEYSGSHRR